MTSPVITTGQGQGSPDGRRHRRPDWSAVGVDTCSNTYGNGDALRPVRADVAARHRTVQDSERTFEKLGWWRRTLRRTGLVLTSPGMVLVSGATSVLLLGLSPWLTDPGTSGDGLPSGAPGAYGTSVTTGVPGPPAPWAVAGTAGQGR